MANEEPGAVARWRARRRDLARRQGWWLVAGAAAVVTWSRLSARTLDPAGPLRLDWVSTLVRSLEFQIGCIILLFALGALTRRAWTQAIAFVALASVAVIPVLATGAMRGAQAAKDPSRHLSVLSINVLAYTRDTEATASSIRRQDPDIILVQEYSPHWHSKLPRLLAPEWELATHETRFDSFGTAAFVRTAYSVDATGTIWELHASTTPQSRLRATLDREDIQILGIHLVPPIGPAGVDIARTDTRQLLDVIDEIEEPLVVAGDFNAIGGSAIDNALQRAGLTDAWEAAGRGPGWTWPRNGALRLAPGVRIDHVYVSRHWRVLRATLLDPEDSDHRPLLVEIALRA